MAYSRGPTVFVVSLVFVTLATVFTVLRAISKWFVTKKTNADDYLVIVGWVSYSLNPSHDLLLAISGVPADRVSSD